MKAIINNIESVSNSQFNLNVTIKKDDGTLILTTDIGFNAVFSDKASAIAYIKEAIKNRALQYIAETTSVSKDEITKILGREFNV